MLNEVFDKIKHTTITLWGRWGHVPTVSHEWFIVKNISLQMLQAKDHLRYLRK